MIDYSKHPDWRLLQVFMNTRTMRCFHVYVHVETHGLACDCPGVQARAHTTKGGDCAHLVYVRKRVSASDGGYPIEACEAPALTPEIAGDANLFREWMLKYSPIANL